jgi:hypothetical protein
MSALTTATTMSESANRFQSAAEIQTEIRATQAELPYKKAQIKAKKAEIEAEIEPLRQALRRKRTELKGEFARWKSEYGLRPLRQRLFDLDVLLFARHRNLLCQWFTHSRALHPIPEGWVKQDYDPDCLSGLERYDHPSRRRTAELTFFQANDPPLYIIRFVLSIDPADEDYEPVTADEATELREALYPMLSSAWQPVQVDEVWFETVAKLFFSDGPQFPIIVPSAEPARS